MRQQLPKKVYGVVVHSDNVKPNYFFSEAIDPFDGSKTDFVLKAEHLGRYLFAQSYITKHRCNSVYDVACGNGYGTKILAEKTNVYGFDRVENKNTQNTHFYTIDLNKIDLTQFVYQMNIRKPDCIVSFETLEHVKDPGKLLRTFRELLSPEGRLIISVPNAVFEPKKKGKSRNKFHLHLFYKENIMSLLIQNGFTVELVLGQSVPNLLMHKSKWLIPFLDRIFLYNEKTITFGTRLLALPSSFYAHFSYSMIIVARKI